MESKFYDELFHYLREKSYMHGSTKDQKRNIRRYSSKCYLEDDHVWVKLNNSKPKIMVRDQDKHRILRACHSDAVSGGHFGRDKTCTKVSER